MKNILNFTATTLLICFIAKSTLSEQIHNTISVNSSTYSNTGGGNEAYFHIFDVEENENIEFTVERTEFDNGPTAHYKIDLLGTSPQVFYFNLQESNTFSATMLKEYQITSPLTIKITDVNRIPEQNPNLPPQNFKLTLSQSAFKTVVLSEDFSNGMGNWQTYVDWNASGYSYINHKGELLTTIDDPGTETWHVHIRRTGIPIIAGETYKVKLRSRIKRSNLLKPFKIIIEEDGGDYTGYGEKYFIANEYMNEVSFKFRSPISDPNAVLCIEIGDFGPTSPLDFIIDNVEIVK